MRFSTICVRFEMMQSWVLWHNWESMSCASPLCQLRHWHHLSRLVSNGWRMLLIISLIYSKHNVSGIRTAFKVFSKVKRSQINQKGRKANAGLTNWFSSSLRVSRLFVSFFKKNTCRSIGTFVGRSLAAAVCQRKGRRRLRRHGKDVDRTNVLPS